VECDLFVSVKVLSRRNRLRSDERLFSHKHSPHHLDELIHHSDHSLSVTAKLGPFSENLIPHHHLCGHLIEDVPQVSLPGSPPSLSIPSQSPHYWFRSSILDEGPGAGSCDVPYLCQEEPQGDLIASVGNPSGGLGKFFDFLRGGDEPGTPGGNPKGTVNGRVFGHRKGLSQGEPKKKYLIIEFF